MCFLSSSSSRYFDGQFEILSKSERKVGKKKKDDDVMLMMMMMVRVKEERKR